MWTEVVHSGDDLRKQERENEKNDAETGNEIIKGMFLSRSTL